MANVFRIAIKTKGFEPVIAFGVVPSTPMEIVRAAYGKCIHESPAFIALFLAKRKVLPGDTVGSLGLSDGEVLLARPCQQNDLLRAEVGEVV